MAGIFENDEMSSSQLPSEINYDEALEKTGPKFRFQMILQLFMSYAVLTTGYNFILSMFTGNEPSWSCVNNSSNTFCELNYGKIIHTYSDHFSEKCKMNRSDWAFTTTKEYSFVTEFDLTCERTFLAALVSASFYIGGFIGTTFSGTIADTYGRRPVLFVSLLIMTCFSIAGSYVKDISQLIGINLIRGAASVANYYTIFVYLSEFSASKLRTYANGLLLFAGPTSFLVTDLLAYNVRNWRTLQLYLACLPVLGLIGYYLFPESPRWLLAKGKKDLARKVLQTISKFNGNAATTKFQLKAPKCLEEKKYTYFHLINTFEVFKLTAGVSALWFAITLTFYTIALGSANLGGNMYKTFALSTLADHAGCLACTFLLNRLGRKRVILGGLFMTGVLMGSLILVPKSFSYKYTFNIVISILGRFTACTAFDGMFTWTVELFPTVLRSQGMSVSVIFERIGMFCCPFITRVLQNISPRLPLIIMCILSVLVSVFGTVLPETNNSPSRELYEDFFQAKEGTNEVGVDNDCIEDENV